MRRPGTSWLAIACAALTALVAALAPAGAAVAQFQEYQVKAAYLYKFAPFVDWPAAAYPAPDSPLVICVAGHDPFGPVLDRAAAGQKFGSRALQVRRLSRVEKGAACHILFIGGSKAQTVADGLAVVRGTPVLTVTDATTSGDERGVIHFVTQNRNIRFEIDDAAAARNGLTISSKLLSLAVLVKARS